MSGSRKSSTSAFAPAAKNVGRPPVSYTVEDAVKLVRKSYWMTPAKLTSWIGKISSWHLSFVVTFLKLVREICTGTTFLSFHLSLSQQVVVNDVKPKVAIMAYGLQDELPCSTLYYKVRVAREKGTYNNDIIKLQTKQQKRLGIVIDLTADGDGRSPTISPITMLDDSIASSAVEMISTTSTTMTTSTGASSTRKRHRMSVKQASQERIARKRTKTDNDGRYKAAFKEATSIVASPDSNETARSIC